MLSREAALEDLRKLRQIVKEHKQPGTRLATHKEVVNGIEMEIFSNIPQSLADVYLQVADISNYDFLVYQDKRFTFGQTYDLAIRLAQILLQQYGIQKGDRIAICSRNNPEWCIAFMAITMMGAIAVPMNSWWTGPELRYGLQDSGAKIVFADRERIARIAPYIKPLGLEVIAINPGTSLAYEEFHSLLNTGKKPINSSLPKVNADDEATIIYTSGSTGFPKGVLATHRNITHALYTWLFVKEINEILRPELRESTAENQPAILANVPLFHVTGCHAQFLACFVFHRKFVMMHKWNPEAALKLIEQEGITIFHGVPTMTWEVMGSPNFEKTDLRSLRSVQSGGASRPPEHLALMLRKFPPRALPGLGYGLTESNAIGAIISGKFYEFNPHSTGRPSPPVTQIKIVNSERQELGPHQSGEICIKGPSVMKGYWKKPEETAAVMADGWLCTGDIGFIDDLGFLIIQDRAKDIVIRGGENISCTEVEYAITEHPAVSEVAVFGIPDARLGEIPCAVVMLLANRKLNDSALRDFLNERLATFKIPAYFYFQSTPLPRIASGKIDKQLIREQTIAK